MPWQFFYLFLFFHVSLRHGLEELVTIPYINYQTIWKHKVSVYINNSLTLSWRRPLSYRNQSIDLLRKSMGWFLYDNGPRHERVKRWSCIKSIQQISDFLIEMSLGNRSSTREFLSNIRNSQKKNSRKKNSNCYWLSILTNYFVKRTFNPIQNGERAKRPPTNFCTVTSTNVRISDWNFLTFSFNPFETLV